MATLGNYDALIPQCNLSVTSYEENNYTIILYKNEPNAAIY